MRETAMKSYSYSGPVIMFDRIVSNQWHGTTYAPSIRKARSNLAFQFKKAYGYESNVPVKFSNDIKEDENDG